MKKNIFIVIYVIVVLVFFKLLYNVIANNVLIDKYNYGIYDSGGAKRMTYFNFPEGYVAHYNYGNILYQNGEYDNAIDEYKLALEESMVPEEKRCSIRINYALAICAGVDVDESNQESIDKAIEKYESAIEVLVEEGCANKNDNNGHSQKAQQLKKDIEKEIERLKNLKQQESSSKDKNNDKQEQTKQEENDPVEKQMQEIKKEAAKAQREKEAEVESSGRLWDEKVEKRW